MTYLNEIKFNELTTTELMELSDEAYELYKDTASIIKYRKMMLSRGFDPDMGNEGTQ